MVEFGFVKWERTHYVHFIRQIMVQWLDSPTLQQSFAREVFTTEHLQVFELLGLSAPRADNQTINASTIRTFVTANAILAAWHFSFHHYCCPFLKKRLLCEPHLQRLHCRRVLECAFKVFANDKQCSRHLLRAYGMICEDDGWRGIIQHNERDFKVFAIEYLVEIGRFPPWLLRI